MRRQLFTLALFFATIAALAWEPVGNPLRTRWAEDISPENVHPEYPRPQMLRGDWKSLNGLWDYAIVPKDAEKPSAYDGQILVPFVPESSLSGVGKRVGEDNALWYRTAFSVPSSWKRQRTLLHFEAVDWAAEVYLNGTLIAYHTGGYTPFSVDITPYLKGNS